MKSLLDPAVRHEIATRLERLQPDTPGQWGLLTAPKMVTHLIDSARMMVDEIPDLPRGKPVLSWPGIKHLIFYVLPVPRGKAPTAPQLLATEPGELRADVTRLGGILDRFAAPGSRIAATHPAFGAMTRDTWGILGYKHFDHHLRQFGL